MSAITVDNDLVHYEVLGRGRPVILLHGWLGSWRYWIPTMQQLSMKYRTYALDLWGFGDSGKDISRYGFDSHVALLREFMEKLGISKAALVGHDLGAAVAVRFALQESDRVPRLMLVAPPLFRMDLPVTTLPKLAKLPEAKPIASQSEADTIPLRSEEMQARIREALDKRAQELGEKHLSSVAGLRSASEAGAVAEQANAAMAAQKAGPAANPLRDYLESLNPVELLEKHVVAGGDQEKLKVEARKADLKALEKSVDSFAAVDTLRDLIKLTMPSLAVYGAADTFLPLPDDAMLREMRDGRETLHVIGMEGPRHFPMLENIDKFSRLVMDFLEAPNVRDLSIKEKWERRVR